MNKYLYVDSEGRVCRIDADTGAMIPVEWNQPDVDAARKRYELARAEIANFDVSHAIGRLNGLGQFANLSGPGSTPKADEPKIEVTPEMIRIGAQILENQWDALPSMAEDAAEQIYREMEAVRLKRDST